MPARLFALFGLTLPLVAQRRLRLTRGAAPLVAVAGVCELAGLASFAWGARDGIAVTAVLGSQFAAISVVAAWWLLHERLGKLQVLGVATIITGVAALTILRS